MVVDDTATLNPGIVNIRSDVASDTDDVSTSESPVFPLNVFVVDDMDAIDCVPVIVPLNAQMALRFQIPAVNEMLVTFNGLPVLNVTAAPDATYDLICSPRQDVFVAEY